MSEHHQEQPEFTAIQARPAIRLESGCRLLMLRQIHNAAEPPAFAWIEQYLLRAPLRQNRHGVSFAPTFRPEIVAWLSAVLGRPSLCGPDDRPCRNPAWPILAWHREERLWPDGTRTDEWWVEIRFPEAASWTAFATHWHARLEGEWEAPPASGLSGEADQSMPNDTSAEAIPRP